MKLFLDSADYKKIAPYAHMGMIDGVTINPSLLKVHAEPPVQIVREMIKQLPEGEICLQVTEMEPEKMYAQAHKIAAIADNMVVKIPCAQRYMSVISRLVQDQVPVNVTLVFTLTQALQIAKLGVNYISLFVGRLEDNNVPGLEVAESVQDMLNAYDFDSELLVASVRSLDHVIGALSFGADAITIPLDIFAQLGESPLTTGGLVLFERDWESGSHTDLV